MEQNNAHFSSYMYFRHFHFHFELWKKKAKEQKQQRKNDLQQKMYISLIFRKSFKWIFV